MATPPLPDSFTDAQAAAGLITNYYRRPINWHCSRCGWYCDHGQSDSYVCKECGQLRPLWAGSATMSMCSRCERYSLALAEYCEWCGAAKLAGSAGR